MKDLSGFRVALIAFAVGLAALQGCSGTDVKNDTLATVNGNSINVRELREFIGLRGGITPAAGVPVEKKKEALDRLIGGRLLAGEARVRGLDNTDEFREAVARNEQMVLITALFRKEIESVKVKEGEIKDEAKKMREADKSLSEADAGFRAGQLVSERVLRKIEDDLVSAARKDFPASIDNAAIGKIASGANVPDDTVLATVGGDKILYGQAKTMLQAAAGGRHGEQDLTKNPMAVQKILEREIAGRALAAYAKKKGIPGTEGVKLIRDDLERSVLIDLFAEKIMAKEVSVTDKDIAAAYVEHGQMFVRDGKKIPLATVKDQIRDFLRNDRLKKSIEARIGELKKKAKITVNEALLPKV